MNVQKSSGEFCQVKKQVQVYEEQRVAHVQAGSEEVWRAQEIKEFSDQSEGMVPG